MNRAAKIALTLMAFAAGDASAGLLTGKNGMTLYTFAQDRPGESACSWHCIKIWPPARVGDAAGPEFGAITREGGERQLTYDGRPLYYFIGDRHPGDANGAGIEQVWYAVHLPQRVAATAARSGLAGDRR